MSSKIPMLTFCLGVRPSTRKARGVTLNPTFRQYSVNNLIERDRVSSNSVRSWFAPVKFYRGRWPRQTPPTCLTDDRAPHPATTQLLSLVPSIRRRRHRPPMNADLSAPDRRKQMEFSARAFSSSRRGQVLQAKL